MEDGAAVLVAAHRHIARKGGIPGERAWLLLRFALARFEEVRRGDLLGEAATEVLRRGYV